LPTIISRLEAELDIAIAAPIQIHYVMLRGAASRVADQPVYIANVYGVKALSFSDPAKGDESKRIRYVFSKEGELLYADNIL